VNEAGIRPYIGGQAVVEGVFMRAPRAVAVAVRTPSGEIRVKAEPYRPFYQRFRVLKLPFVRGAFVMIDSLVVGIRALNWSAEQAALPSTETDNGKDGGNTPERKLGSGEKAALGGTLALSFLFGIALFVALPHLLTSGLGTLLGKPLDVDSALFHLVDGGVKLAIFLGYLGIIRRIGEIRRVFAYHGAEHKTIYAYEQGLPLTVENVRVQSRFHPRCGTSFLLFVIAVSILVFAAVFPLLPPIPLENRLLKNLVQVAIKIPLTLPVAAVSYEIIRLSSRMWRYRPFRALALPGLLLQRWTTEEPDDAQMEVAIRALASAFEAEQALPGEEMGLEGEAFPTGSTA
jgi:uncharacterized protein YqhQ